MARIVFGAPHSGSGKTTVCMGILRALVAKGYAVTPFKVGPDFIDTAYHARICGRNAINLDAFLLGEEGVKSIFADYHDEEKPESISVIEGVMGLYDGLGSTTYSSTFHIAQLTQTPIVLVMDGRGMAATAAALVQGLLNFGPASIQGIILNKLSSERHYRTLEKAILPLGIPCLGYMPQEHELWIDSRHLGILPTHELDAAEEKMMRMQKLAEEHIDLDRLLSIAASAPAYLHPQSIIGKVTAKSPTIAVAMDRAFNFYYADNLRLMERMGAKIKYFSPLQDDKLPDCDGVYIGGGFPEVFAKELAGNRSMRQSMKMASAFGLPIYAECGGYMYLMEQIIDKSGGRQAMCGIFLGNAQMGRRLNQQFGYISSVFLKETPIGSAGFSYHNHEFHHSDIDSPDPVYQATKEASGESWTGGHVIHNTFGSYAHAYFRGKPEIVQHFLQTCERFRS